MTDSPQAAQPKPVAKPAAKPHNLAALLTDTELVLPADLANDLRQVLANPVTAKTPAPALQAAVDVYRNVAEELEALEAAFSERSAEEVRAAEESDERLTEARSFLAHVKEGIGIGQIEWLQHRIPAQQQDVLRTWWPADGIQSEFLSRDDLVFSRPNPEARRQIGALDPVVRERFGVQLLVELYRVVVHDLCGGEVATRGNAEYVRGDSGLSRAMMRHFGADPNNPFAIHARAVAEIQKTLMLPDTWPEWPAVPIASAKDVLSANSLADHVFDENGNAAKPLAECDKLLTAAARTFVACDTIAARLEAVTVEYRPPTWAESVAKSFRANVQYLGVIGAVATAGDLPNKHVTIMFGLFCLVLAFFGKRQDDIEAKDAAARVMDQKLRQFATKELASVTDKLQRAIRAFHVTAAGKIVQETETRIRQLKAPSDAKKRAIAARGPVVKARAAAHRAYCVNMVTRIEGVLKAQGG